MKLSSSCGSFPPLSPKYQWFIAQDPQADKDGNGDHFFFNIQDPLSFYRCRIPELCKKRIRGSYHGWFILSDDDNMWSLWDPLTSNIKHLPPLVLTDGDSKSIKECCLSLPPDDPNSILLLTRTDKTTFVFCLLNRGRKKLKWTEISYTKPLTRISGDGCFIQSLCCCNGKVYALNTDNHFYGFVIEIRIVVKDGRVAIKLMLFAGRPVLSYFRGYDYLYFLRGSNTELFFITIGFNFHVRRDTAFSLVTLHKLDMTSLNCAKLEGLKKWDITGKRPGELDEEEVINMFDSADTWERLNDLKDGYFFVDLARDNSVAYSPTIASEFGGNIHIRSRMGKVIYSYNLSDRTVLVSSMFPSPLLPINHVSVWDCRLAADYAKAKQEVEDKDCRIMVRLVNDDDVEFDESLLLSLPLHVLEMIMEFCIGLEYLNFRATCKVCHLAAPVVQWKGEVALKRLQNYSLLSPWLMLADEKGGVVSFEDPLYGYKFFMKNLRAPIADGEVCYSGYGWLLYYSEYGLECCNPFTDEVLDLPKTENYFYSLCFSAPPSSPDCMVVGFDMQSIYIHFVHGEQTWRLVSNLVDDDDDGGNDGDDLTFYYLTFYGRDLYALCVDGKLHVFKNLGQDYSGKKDIVETPRLYGRSYPVEYFLTKCDRHMLLVFVDHFGESIEVFRLNEPTKEWEKTNSLGRHTIYISDSACLCIEAKTPEAEDKIFFARLYNKNGKVVFYSLKTGMHHTLNDKNIEESFGDFLGTKHPLYPMCGLNPIVKLLNLLLFELFIFTYVNRILYASIILNVKSLF